MTNEAFQEIERVFGLLSEQLGTQLGGVPVDVVDAGDAFEVRADLPGYDADDVDVTLRDARTVRITAERERDEVDGRYVKHERRRRTADRTITLPEPVEAGDASASYDAGVLSVHVPKRPESDEQGTDVPVN